jgi:hypothetical protein
VLKGRMGGEAAAPHRPYRKEGVPNAQDHRGAKAHPAVDRGLLTSNRQVTKAVHFHTTYTKAQNSTPNNTSAVHPGPFNALVWSPSPSARLSSVLVVPGCSNIPCHGHPPACVRSPSGILMRASTTTGVKAAGVPCHLEGKG